MARLPVPGQDDGTWGDVLNDYLLQTHTTDGALKPDAVSGAALQDGSVTNAAIEDGSITAPKLSAAGGSTGEVLVRDNGVTGGIKWDTVGGGGTPSGPAGGDLSGTYPNPTVPGLANKVTANSSITGATNTKITYDAKGLVTAGAAATQDDIGDGVTFKQYSGTEKTKLAGIATGATANSPDATLLNRANHTGTQTASTISDFNTAADARITAATGTTIQPLDSDLTAIAGLTPTNDDIIQRKAGAWTNRTPAQLKTDLALTKTDVGLANVDNTSDANKPVSTAVQNALNGKEPTITAGTTAQYWRGDKSWQTLDKTAVGLANVDNTSDANKPISTATQTALNGKLATPTFVTVMADQANSTQTLTDITGLSLNVGIGTYEFDFQIPYTGSTTATTLNAQLNGPTNSYLFYTINIQNTNTTIGKYFRNTFASSQNGGATSNTATQYMLSFTGWVVTTASGTLQPQFCNFSASTTVTAKAGMYGRLQRIA